MRSAAAFTENHQTPRQPGSAGFLAPKYLAALLIFIFSITFYEFEAAPLSETGFDTSPRSG
jgi:hypothetical protein